MKHAASPHAAAVTNINCEVALGRGNAFKAACGRYA